MGKPETDAVYLALAEMQKTTDQLKELNGVRNIFDEGKQGLCGRFQSTPAGGIRPQSDRQSDQGRVH